MKIKQIGRRTFHHEGQNYECLISIKIMDGKVVEIEFAWNIKPPCDAMKFHGYQKWSFGCFKAIDDEFGARSAINADVRTTVAGMGTVLRSELVRRN